MEPLIPPAISPLKRDLVEPLGRSVPVSGLDAAQTLLKLDLVRLDNLLFILGSVPSPTPLKMPEVKRWYSQWLNEWLGTVQRITIQTQRHPAALRSPVYTLLQYPSDRRLDASGVRTTGAFIDSMNDPELTLQALLVRHEQAMEKLGVTGMTADKTEGRKRSPVFSTNSLVPFRERNASYLFGTVEGRLKELRLISIPNSYRWSEGLFNRSTLRLAMLVVFLLAIPFVPFTELLQRFPGFWGVGAGILLIGLFPPGFWGGVVLLLVTLSAFHSPWSQRRVMLEKN